MSTVYDVIIIGSGPAGYTAALYCSRANLKTLLIEGFEAGGALMQTTDVENYPGFPDGILGPDLMMNMSAQAERFGAVLEMDNATRLDLSGSIKKVWCLDVEYQGKTVILATGSKARTLGIEGEEEYSGRGVSYCATCDGAFFENKNVTVIGGGDSAMEEALFLTKFADTVTIVNRSSNYRASQIMLERARANEKITFIDNYKPYKIFGENNKVTRIALAGTITRDIKMIDTDGVFIAIGHDPRNSLFKDDIILDDQGYVLTHQKNTKTNLDGVFAAGDLADPRYQQAITAAGSGCKAALDVEEYLNNLS